MSKSRLIPLSILIIWIILCLVGVLSRDGIILAFLGILSVWFDDSMGIWKAGMFRSRWFWEPSFEGRIKEVGVVCGWLIIIMLIVFELTWFSI